MRAVRKLALGAVSASLGGAGIILGPLLGFSELGRPWSFVIGFVFGVLTGIGSVLSLFGLHERKRGLFAAKTEILRNPYNI